MNEEMERLKTWWPASVSYSRRFEGFFVVIDERTHIFIESKSNNAHTHDILAAELVRKLAEDHLVHLEIDMPEVTCTAQRNSYSKEFIASAPTPLLAVLAVANEVYGK